MEFEKLGSFYLGKGYDVKSSKLLDQLVMYDARDLTTHAFCVGMTASVTKVMAPPSLNG